MPDLTQLVANRRTTVVDTGVLGGEDIRIEYYLARVTTQMIIEAHLFDKLDTLPFERAQELMEALPDTLATLLASWDITTLAEDGSGVSIPLPIDREHIAGLGFLLQVAILRTILSGKGEASALGALTVSAPASSAS